MSTGVRDGPASAIDEHLAKLSASPSPIVNVSRAAHEAIQDAVGSQLWGNDMSEVTCAVRGRLVVASDTNTHVLTWLLLSQILCAR